MTNPNAHTLPIIVVGAGMTGLAAAWELQQRGVPYVLLEAGDSFGGKVQSERTEDEFLVEKAADAFILGKPWALQLAQEVGLQDELIHPRAETKKLYFLRGGELLDFPQNLKMFVPLDDESFLQSGVLSPEGLRRMLDEQNVPPKENTDEDESLADFIIRRFGAEAMNFIVPLAAGIYVANPFELSMKAAFPQFLALEQKYGSVIKGSRATPRAQGPIFGSFKDGMSTLANAVAAKLTGDVRLNTPVLAVHPDGVTLTGGEKIAASGVVLTAPAWVAAPTLGQSFPAASALVGELQTNGSVAVILAYREGQFPRDMHLHGLQVAADEGIEMKAITVHSAKLHGRAPEGHVLLRVFFKDLDPQKALAEAVHEVARLFGAQGDPLWHAYADWRGKNPAYQVGHLDHIARIRAALPPNIQVAGSSYTGVGIPDCVNAGRTAARDVVAALGVDG
ncbi:protoporphyrinogen oxidase [Deinococcus radiodurans]|jgi:protoporphyrinogen oxidase (EC 1.3.3.4)|nr:protoporphyrinogen oxidase [Deinococcus radiodurans]ANC71693.1 protoporphyrinogen oxidase [Deinococcus radiodurans R1 = ATCC 13939 = DSM 20539]QIP29216.1 protoporphyrinogen oxidase [Deinococcus radiodurans]QIP32090.1 protoporphyrinogen oxidase [Deinococcus radiodurans]UID70124.1 protoporphyrinogen oxidase [Deinococcus radiodurans R1 = ATCC 13939 = DSM 20539]UTA50642.1 protoporphyrinogen oxidase [Deinococcus radiodurans]